MVLLHLLLICQMVIPKIFCTVIPERVSFNVLSDQNVDVNVNLVAIPASESFLANENVQVWIPNEQFPVSLDLVEGVVASLGPFTMYRDPNTCAAALYFHRQQKFDGVVGHHSFIRKLHYNTNARRVEPSMDTVFPSSIAKHNERLPEGEEIVEHGDEGIVYHWDQSLRTYPQTVFIETLVIINHDITDEIYDHSAIASFVLTLFNNIEMIFSKIQTPQIKFNIAGIIIATSQESFPQLNSPSCYHRTDEGYRLDISCALRAVRKTLYGYSEIPFRSYDVAVFLTKYELFEWGNHETRQEGDYIIEEVDEIIVRGMAYAPTASNSYREDPQDLTIAIVSRPDIHQLLPVAAHEIAHMFSATHGSGPLWNKDRMCDAHLMKMDKHLCQRCFRFDQQTMREFKEFFGSRQACIFHNEPRSLDPRPRLFWKEKEQCKCYGYPKVHKSKKNICSPRMSLSCVPPTEANCKSHLICQSKDNKQHKTGVLMDGTPCDIKRIGTKVCWDGECMPVH